ncbi:succinate dehydrogenase, hydrophobic membrane anchor protein [Acidocella sp.]|uniref:succinate dehydrogenase, hydrophobic membrane anchor protein n=1 Tax=Acidocella sp. TaxID=50710 RepID=UPI00261FCE63|nr:succinate dehydrogenase, hydrophobic membrane anchor protein [Acidocella sp.]
MSKHNPAPSINIRRSSLGRARGLGAAKTGSAHWWAERLTSVALLPLVLYFVVSVLVLKGADHAAMVAYMAEPWNTVLYIALIAALFYHLDMGMQVVIEDYVRTDVIRITVLLVVKAGIALLALACLISVLKLAFS